MKRYIAPLVSAVVVALVIIAFGIFYFAIHLAFFYFIIQCENILILNLNAKCKLENAKY